MSTINVRKIKIDKEIVSYAIIFALVAEVAFLTLQNRELKHVLSTNGIPMMGPLQKGEQASSFQIQTLDGNLTDFKYSGSEKKYLLFVLSTICPHCEKNLSNWRKINSSSKDRCNIIGIAIQQFEEAQRYAVEKSIPFYLVSAVDSTFSTKYKILGTPTTILLNANGEVEKSWVGELSEEATIEIERMVGA